MRKGESVDGAKFKTFNDSPPCFIYLFFLIVEQVFSIFSCKMSNVNKVADEIKMSFERPNDQKGGQNLFFNKYYKLDFAGVNPIAKPESESELQKTHTYL